MAVALLGGVVPKSAGLPTMWWIFWWLLGLVAFVTIFWWWTYRGVQHDRRARREHEAGEPAGTGSDPSQPAVPPER